jgi:hypothetical protein
VVLVNTSVEDITVSADLSVLSASAPSSATYAVASHLRPDAWTGEGLAGRVSIAAQDAEFLYIEWQGGEQGAKELADAAEARIAACAKQDAVTPYTEYAGERMREHLEAENWSKAAAYALAAYGQLGMSVECPTEWSADGRIRIAAQFLDVEGKPVKVDNAWVEFTPTQGLALPLRRSGQGEYDLTLRREDLPQLYNYATKEYEPFAGPLRLRIAGSQNNFEASRFVDVMVVGVREPARAATEEENAE